LIATVLAGLLAGFVHVLTGPDHLAAIAPYATEARGRSWLVGLRWGLGHTSGVMVVGLLTVLLRGILPVHLLSAWSERCVGLVLIVIGIWGIRTAWTRRLHTHEHVHDGRQHIHVHLHRARIPHGDPDAHVHNHAAFAVGTLHGLAGSSHVLGVLPALMLPSDLAAAAYLGTFGAGSIAGMAGFSCLVGWLATTASARGVNTYQGLLCICSFAAITVGGVWLFQ
jgi:hypothetical protein